MASSDDVINAIGASPGVITAITSNTTYNYTPATNVEVTLTISVSAASSAVQVNGVTAAAAGSTYAPFATVKFNLAKSQTAVITTLSGATVLVSSRSIQ